MYTVSSFSLIVYLELLVQFLLDPVSHVHQSDLPLTQFRPRFQLQVRRTPETIPDSRGEIFMVSYIISYELNCSFRELIKRLHESRQLGVFALRNSFIFFNMGHFVEEKCCMKRERDNAINQWLPILGLVTL